jgi:hypothetical protein
MKKFKFQQAVKKAIKQRKCHSERAVFADNIYGWKKTNPETFIDMSPQARATLSRFGYVV